MKWAGREVCVSLEILATSVDFNHGCAPELYVELFFPHISIIIFKMV